MRTASANVVLSALYDLIERLEDGARGFRPCVT